MKRILTITALAAMSLPLSAQEEVSTVDLSGEIEEQESPSSSSGKVERMEVTGSHIKRVDVEGPSPIQTLDQEYLQQTGYNSVGDVLRDITSNSFGSLREQAGSNAAGVASVNLRGLGATRTLVLMNGKRLAKDGVTGSPDLNLIPMAAIERIDILKDASSATYGSDALGGVVNVITKKNFDGTEMMFRQEVVDAEGGNRTTVSLAHGQSTDRSNFMISAQYRDNKEILSKDREWTKDGASNYSPFTNIGKVGQGTQAGPDCPASQVSAVDGKCKFNYNDFSWRMPNIKQANALASFNFDLNADTSFYAQASGTRKETEWQYAPGAVLLLNIPSPSAVPSQGINAGDPVNIQWRSLPLGNRISEITTNAYSATFGVKRYISDTWEVSAEGGTEFVKREDLSTNGYADDAKLKAAIAAGTFNPITNQGTLSDDIRYNPSEIVTSELSFGEVKASGELFNIPGGAVAMAIGGMYTYEKFSDEYDALSLAGGVAGGGAGSSGYGTRQFMAAYTEVIIPALENLEIQLAGRADRYSDFGNTFNPKIGLKWKPFSSLLLRASAGTGFKAPDMVDMYNGGSSGAPTFIDAKGCADGVAGACAPQQYTVTSNGNAGLEEETSKSFSVGAVFEPARGFNVSADYFAIQMDNVVGLDYAALTEAEASGVDLSQYNTTVQRDASGNLVSINTQLQNLAQRKVSGLDFSLGYSKLFKGFGEIVLKNETSYLLNYEEQGFPGTEFQSTLQSNGAPQWRNSVSLEYGPTEKLKFAANFLTTGSHFKSVAEEGKLNEHTQIDAQVSYLAFRDTKVTLGVKNIYGKPGPLDNTNPNNKLEETIYDPIGRRFFASLRQTF